VPQAVARSLQLGGRRMNAHMSRMNGHMIDTPGQVAPFRGGADTQALSGAPGWLARWR
jgi:hypothetical protein